VAPISDWKVLVNDISKALIESGLVDDVPYAFLGHSFGAILAAETARSLDATMVAQRPRPIHIFASAHTGPATATAYRYDASSPFKEDHPMYKLSEADLVQAVERFEFLPSELLTNEGLLKAVLPALRADIQMYETYQPHDDRKPLPCSVTAIGGQKDFLLSEAALQSWAQDTKPGQFRGVHQLPGNHFYLHDESRDETLKLLVEHIDDSLASLPKSLEKSTVNIPDYVFTTTTQDVIRMRAEKHPDMLALVDENEQVTYGELMRRVDLLAADLHQRFLKGERQKVVALLMPHDITYIIGMLAIFSGDAIFIVIEAHFPPDMAKEISEENHACLALTSPQHTFKFADWLPTIEMGKDWLVELEERNPHFEMPQVEMHDVAILMMTSGTTGRPKTIAGSHKFMTLGFHAKSLADPYEEGCRHAHNVMFVWEVLAPLMHGGMTSYVLPDSSVIDPQVFVNFLEKWAINRTLTTPSLLNTIMQYCSNGLGERLKSMNAWLTCGEVLSMKTVKKFNEILPNVKLINDYSTWESGDVAYALIDPAKVYLPSPTFSPAGYLAPGVVGAVIDPNTKQLVPRGICGELYTGGHCVSYGYFSMPDATAEKFVLGFNEDMLAAWDGRWYKSGDLCRFVGERDQGPPVLEIRGRMDSTVKIRGFKVGMPVVEAAIQEVPGVSTCGVVPIYSAPGIVDCLCAYVGTQEGVDFEALVQKIKVEGPKKIPRWMMPAFIKPMPKDALGGGESKKLDRRRLSSVSLESLKAEAEAAKDAVAETASDSDSQEEAGGVRGIVRTVWAKSLNLDARNLDLAENFFDLGGHSTLAAKMANELSNDYGLPITVLDIYSHSTLGALLEFIDPQGQAMMSIEPRKLRIPKVSNGVSVTVAGLAGRFPGAVDAETFWQNLCKGAVSATFMSPDLLRRKGIPEDVIADKEFIPCGYIMEDVDKFDHLFFNIGKHEASLMDPQHRVFIETAWAAFENAAIPPRGGLSDDVVGTFAAAGIDGYLVHHLDGTPLKDAMNPQDIFLAEVGNEKDYIATRVAYLLDFTGPAMNVNSACSSALVAVAQGGFAITSGQCDAAVCGGSSITFPNLGYRYQDGLVNSIDGFVRPFDKAADGTVFGDSVGAIVLRKIDDVQKSNGLSWGSLLGFSVTNDGGQKAGYAAPSSVGQSHAVMNALRMNDTDPWSLSYVECHATGTRIGDGIEVRGLIDSFNQVGGKKDASALPVVLGSVKGNIAHANCAAGATGLIKLLTMLRSRQLVPTANFQVLNPKVNLEGTPFQISTELQTWDASERPLRGGVSSFGIGGTNAHAVVEEVPANKVEPGAPKAKWGFHVIPFSAKSPESLKAGADSLAEQFKSGSLEDMAGTAFTLQTGRVAQPLRKAVVVTEDFEAAAETIAETMPSEEELDELEEAARRPTVAFIFPGQGSQYFGMGRDLYQDVALYRNAVDKCCDQLMRPELLGKDLRPILFSVDADAEKQFSEPSILQPSLFVTEYAMAQLLLTVGVSPVAAGGHSLGEYCAATIGGLITLEDALSIVAARAKATETLAKDGAMLAVADWPADELEFVRGENLPGLWLAAVNSPVHAVISGETEAITSLESELKASNRKCTRLHIKKAFHSGLISEAADTLKGLGVPSDEGTGAAQIPVTSNLTGGWLTLGHLKDGTYWTKHMRNGVMWKDNAEKLMKQWTPSIVLEVGPGNSLSTLTKKCIIKGTTAPVILQAMRHPKSTGVHDVAAFMGMLGQLWEAGCDVNWQALYTDVLATSAPPSLRRLPSYSFNPISLWEKPGRSIYVEGDAEPDAIGVAATSQSASAPTAVRSPYLVRFGDEPEKEPALRAYCLPFAGGSSLLFAPWTEQVDAHVEVIAIEMPGRGGRAEEALPSDDVEDARVIEKLCKAILDDVKGAQYVLVGFSMGGNLAVEIALRMAAMKAQTPLGLYIAGRKPPAASAAAVGTIDMSDDALASYAMAAPEVVRSVEFREHALPKLRADLELDLRVEKRLAGMNGQRLPSTVSFDAFCGTDDQVAPWSLAQGWQRFTQSPIGMNFMPGGHEFLQAMRPMIFAVWKQNALGRLMQMRTMELASLASAGFAPGSTVPQSAANLEISQTPSRPELPLYAVKWVPLEIGEPIVQSALPQEPLVVDLSSDFEKQRYEDAVAAMRRGVKVLVKVPTTEGSMEGKAFEEEQQQCWRFVHFVQQVLDLGGSGRIVVVCSSGLSGGMIAGASKAISIEASELKIQRVFLPMNSSASNQNIVELADKYPDESDLWVQTTFAQPFAQRLEHMLEPSTKLPCVPKRGTNGELAKFVLTGATGGLGSAVVEWLVNDQGLSPDQLVLLRRSGSSQLAGVLAKCQVVEVPSPDDYEALLASGLQSIANVAGIFHLAGVLDDGIIGSMTDDRLRKVAQPKCGIAISLLRAAVALKWPLQWFLCFSSTSSLFGNGGQVNYCAANGMLDQWTVFGDSRSVDERTRLPCRIININWGPWGEAGMSKVGTKAYEQAVKDGETPLKTAVALRCLAAAVRSATKAQPTAVQFCGSDVDWTKTQWKDLSIADLIADRAKPQGGAANELSSNSSQEGAKGEASRASIEEFMASFTSQPWSRIQRKSLVNMGFDSLEIVGLRNQFNKSFGVNVPLKVVAEPSQKIGDLVTSLESYVIS
jgi:acyl transferase domain-containing protein/acyl-coenzyme A synthetase/AMP-(fatty) acid ligase/acyl carrier protein